MSSYHGWAHRPHEHGGTDPLTGPWVRVINEGDTPPTVVNSQGTEYPVQYVELQNGWTQPAAGAGPSGEDLEEFAFRRGGVNKLDFTGHLDGAGAASGSVALTLPVRYRLLKTKFFYTILVDLTPAKVTVASSGDVTIEF